MDTVVCLINFLAGTGKKSNLKMKFLRNNIKLLQSNNQSWQVVCKNGIIVPLLYSPTLPTGSVGPKNGKYFSNRSIANLLYSRIPPIDSVDRMTFYEILTLFWTLFFGIW